MKKFITVMLSMVLIISCMIMPVSAFASQEITVNGDLSYEKLKMENSDNVPPVVPAEGTFGNDLLWNVDSNNKLTISGTGEMPDFNLESDRPWHNYREIVTSVEIKDGITNVSKYAFGNFENLISVSLPDSITEIEANAFAYCWKLTSINMPYKLKSIGSNAFNVTGIQSIIIPDGVTYIGGSAFKNAQLTSVIIPDGIKQIYEKTFAGCPLTSVSIPDSVTVIGYAAFYECDKLTSIIIPESVSEVSDRAFYGCTAIEQALIEGEPYIADGALPAKKYIYQRDINFGSITISPDKMEYTGNFLEPDVTVKTYLGKTLKEGTDYEIWAWSDNRYAGTGEVTIYGTGQYRGKIKGTFEITKPGTEIIFEGKDIVRIGGADRYETSVCAADQLKKRLGIREFDNIVVASGDGYADALSGTYLAKVKNAPVLLVGDNGLSEKYISKYIDNNLSAGGTVYILGGTGVITQNFENILKDGSHKVERLGGTDRYATNMMILEAAGAASEDMLVCSGDGFADALSASAVGKPVLLVNKNLYDGQKSYLDKLSGRKYYIIGGNGAVSSAVEKEIKIYGKTVRLCGDNRYATSSAVAREFFGDKAEAAVFAFGDDFPDGLSAGPLAASIEAPLLLVTSTNTADAAAYVSYNKITKAAVMGGPKLIPNSVIYGILNS